MTPRLGGAPSRIPHTAVARIEVPYEASPPSSRSHNVFGLERKTTIKSVRCADRVAVPGPRRGRCRGTWRRLQACMGMGGVIGGGGSGMVNPSSPPPRVPSVYLPMPARASPGVAPVEEYLRNTGTPHHALGSGCWSPARSVAGGGPHPEGRSGDSFPGKRSPDNFGGGDNFVRPWTLCDFPRGNSQGNTGENFGRPGTLTRIFIPLTTLRGCDNLSEGGG